MVLPAYVAAKGPKPDLPGTGPGVDDAYLGFPRATLYKAAQQPPGRGGDVEKILRENIPSYHTPNVTLIEEPKLGPVSLTVAGDRKIEALQLEAVLVDSAGMNRRQKMIGYARGDAFIRIMTGTVESPACANATTKAFLTALKWP